MPKLGTQLHASVNGANRHPSKRWIMGVRSLNIDVEFRTRVLNFR